MAVSFANLVLSCFRFWMELQKEDWSVRFGLGLRLRLGLGLELASLRRKLKKSAGLLVFFRGRYFFRGNDGQPQTRPKHKPKPKHIH